MGDEYLQFFFLSKLTTCEFSTDSKVYLEIYLDVNELNNRHEKPPSTSHNENYHFDAYANAFDRCMNGIYLSLHFTFKGVKMARMELIVMNNIL